MLPVLNVDQVFKKIGAATYPARQGFLAMYSSWFGGIVTDPALMFVPIDDHLVHRGDGIFEAIKFEKRRVYALDRHLARLVYSAERLHFQLPYSIEEIRNLVVQTVQQTGVAEGLIRLYVSRGPGGFTTNPYECVGSQLYIVVTKLSRMPNEKYEQGVQLKTCSIPIKEGFFANVKSCNYLQNVLVKKDAVDAGVDFSVTLDDHGFLAESSTENCAIISRKNEFLVPSFKHTLRGITATRMMELARQLVESGSLAAVRESEISVADAYNAKEMMMLGTTLDVLPVSKYDGHTIGDGQVGPMVREFYKLLRADIEAGDLGVPF